MITSLMVDTLHSMIQLFGDLELFEVFISYVIDPEYLTDAIVSIVLGS